MKKILLPTDFSENAWNAIFYALKLFKGVPAHFHILNTFDPNPRNKLGSKTSLRLGMLLEALAKSSKEGLTELKEYLLENHSEEEHTFEFHSIRGELQQAMKSLIGPKDIDVVVMGTHGATGARKIFMGSNAVRVIKSVNNCPVIAVPEGYNFQTLRRIVFPTDFTHFYDKYELIPLIELASHWESEIQVFHLAIEFVMSSLQNTNRKVLKDRLKTVDFKFHEVRIQTTITEGILDFADEQKADMIALIHYKHTFLEKINLEAVVKKIGYKTKTPLLVLPELAQ